jgi:dihydroorotase
LADGTIDLVCSDHTPVDDDSKQVPSAKRSPARPGLELLLPLTLKWAREDGIALPEALARVTTQPAAVLGSAAGHLAVGAAADVCIFDPELFWRVEPRRSRARARTRRSSDWK